MSGVTKDRPDVGKLRVAFLHPDLGIGGAERLVVDAAMAMKARGHDVHFFTPHHDPKHCFPETRDTLGVTVCGNLMPRSVCGRFQALCAYIRMVLAAVYLVVASGYRPNVIFCDQVSACILVLRLLSPSTPIIFYCHFPDQLLTTRQSWLKKLYRMPIDWLEEYSTGCAHKVLVNSNFTAGIFKHTFQRLKLQPEVLYPSLNTAQFDAYTGTRSKRKSFTFLSINRYERKKNLGLALKAFARLRTNSPSADVQLIMAGGFDPRVPENIEHFSELQQLSRDLNLRPDSDVLFLQSPSDSKKFELLHTSHVLLYTPSNEHFGIVPLEAMYCGLPVIAVNSGGPTETVVNGETGFLCLPEDEDFCQAMTLLYNNNSKTRGEMSVRGHQRVAQHFSFEAFGSRLESICKSCCSHVKLSQR